jgi:prepilin-type N-terminal cleavage/methylation domain-containing protein
MRSCSRSTPRRTAVRSGLTLIELLIVVTIFLVLTTFTVRGRTGVVRGSAGSVIA